MKCKVCGFENIESARFCSFCGERLEEMECCTNPDCENFSRYVIPLAATFCPVCGKKIEVKLTGPFHERYPEYHLIPYTEFLYKGNVFFFFFNQPDYIENSSLKEGKNFLFIARNGKLGVLKYIYYKRWFGDYHNAKRIIPYEYEKIERKDDYFICYKYGFKFFLDNEGNIIK